ncbi:hypothetical protein AMS68_006631 [Peltaster fructicola]|uniref:RING-type domain-containing protein n=1 Tax=Peltaster fructicola TaxID=286661 RepID=A0A6H0Y274_9PEZI|nr:hypothetical protein AMS68_006631 [Peltaster fructicola]
MAETCIVCLSDLRHSGDQSLPSETSVQDAGDEVQTHASQKRSLRNTRLTSKSIADDDEIVAHLLPCKHNLHNACLKPWVERANSCPICRATFNTVELSTAIGGEVIDTYAVQDKVQEAQFDAAAIISNDDELFEWDAEAPCTICDMIDESHEVMYCDGCDLTAHVFCAGFSEQPDVWYCMDCQADAGMVDVDTQQRPTTTRRRRARQAGDSRGRRNVMEWARVWQAVIRQVDIDLDFPFNEDINDTRTEEQRREFQRWQRRFQVADRQGNARRFRESQEVIRAWNAFEKARESQEDLAQPRRKRQRTDSPVPRDEGTEQRQLKTTSTTSLTNTEQPHAESSTSAAQRAADEPTFLSALLREVEQKPVNAGSPGASEGQNGQQSPRNSSPIRSPSSSGHATPRALSVEPLARQSASPPLCSTIFPPQSPPGLTFSPFSPTLARPESDIKRHQRGRALYRVDGATQNGMSPAEPSSPTSDKARLSLASKEEIQRMVKIALKPRFTSKQVSVDEYTNINREVSRRMYNLVGSATALANEQERAKWQDVAEKEVQRAITALAEFNATALDTDVYESAGVTGLTTANFLVEAGYDVTIIAAHVPGDKSIEYTSPWAGAHWMTHATPNEPTQQDWDIQTYEYMLNVIDHEGRDPTLPRSGLKLVKGYKYFTGPITEELWWAPYVKDFKQESTIVGAAAEVNLKLPKDVRPIDSALSYTSISINSPHYLLYLQERARKLGAVVIKSRITATSGFGRALAATEELLKSRGRPSVSCFVNATGLGAYKLCDDKAMYPIRGQTVLVKGEADFERTRVGDGLATYCIPRPGSGTTILGGTREENNWSETPDPRVTESILERNSWQVPELLTSSTGGFEVVSVQCGLRPGRKGGPRVEQEDVGSRRVVHAYGHAGAGYQNSVGCARLVVKLVKASLADGSAKL